MFLDLTSLGYAQLYLGHGITILTVRKTYNWDSRSNADTSAYAGLEYVPMLHSNHPDHTGKWDADISNAALANKDLPTHLLGFNEPDNCE